MIPFEAHCRLVEKHLADRYAIQVVTRDVPDPLLGDLDGETIHIDHAVTAEQRLFLLAHLFGHTVQWNTSPEAFDLGRPRQPPVSPDVLPTLLEYERVAASYALSMLHEAGIRDADRWLAEYTARDIAYLACFYVTGEKRDFESFPEEAAPIAPRRIPRFVPQRRALRSDGIVI